MTNAAPQHAKRTIRESLQEYARGIAGGLLFSLPLLYTMEIWQYGVTLSPLRQLLGLLVAYVLLLGYNRFTGLHPDASFWEVAIDSVEELGIGLVVATLVLWVVGQIRSEMNLSDVLGKITIEGFIVAVGVSVGTAQLGAGSGEKDDGEQNDQDERKVSLGGELVVALCGATLIAANVAATEEIIQIGFESTPERLLILLALSISLCALILFYIDFRGTERLSAQANGMSMVRSVSITYACALLASAALLWFFGRYDGLGLGASVSATVVLAAAAALGASAGRLLLQAGS